MDIYFEGNLTGNAYLNISNKQIIEELRQIHKNGMTMMWWINLLTDVFNARIIAVNHDLSGLQDQQI